MNFVEFFFIRKDSDQPRPTDEKWSDRYINQLMKDAPEIKEALELAQEFSELIKNRRNQ